MKMKQLITYTLAILQVAMGLMIPSMQAQAAAGELAWAAPTKYVWRNTETGIPVQMWDVEWNTLATVNLQNKSAYDVRMTNGPQWITKGLRAGGLAEWNGYRDKH
jgi:hypothetical protein